MIADEYGDEKQVTVAAGYQDGVESDGDSSHATITALVAEGERLSNTQSGQWLTILRSWARPEISHDGMGQDGGAPMWRSSVPGNYGTAVEFVVSLR